MQSLAVNHVLNAQVVAKAVIKRHLDRGTVPFREDVLEEMKFTDDEDTGQWASMVDQLLAKGCPDGVGCPS